MAMAALEQHQLPQVMEQHQPLPAQLYMKTSAQL